MNKGTVKWFNKVKGYGFISTEDGDDIFVHYSEIQTDGFKQLKEGEKVEFEVVNSKKGPAAAKVKMISSIVAYEIMLLFLNIEK